MSNKSGGASPSRCSRRPPSPRCLSAPVLRLHVGALLTPLPKKPSKKSLFLTLGGQTPTRGLLSGLKTRVEVSSLLAGRAGSPRSQLWNSGSLTALAAMRVSRVGRGSVCVGRTALCVRVNPRLRFSPLLLATTRMYHHVTVGCPQRDRTPSTPRFDPPIL